VIFGFKTADLEEIKKKEVRYYEAYVKSRNTCWVWINGKPSLSNKTYKLKSGDMIIVEARNAYTKTINADSLKSWKKTNSNTLYHSTYGRTDVEVIINDVVVDSANCDCKFNYAKILE